MSGTYVLAIGVTESTSISVGALGNLEFAADAYAYVGSAFGPGGFSRVDRHRELAVATARLDTGTSIIYSVIQRRISRVRSRSRMPIGSVNWRGRCPANPSLDSAHRTVTARRISSRLPTRRRFERRRSTRAASSTDSAHSPLHYYSRLWNGSYGQSRFRI